MIFFKSHPNLTVIISCLFWGTYWIPLRFIDKSNNGSVWPIFITFILLSIILIIPLFRTFKIFFRQKNHYFFYGCLFSALGVTLYSESLLRGEIARVVILFYLCPIWGTILAKIFLKQTLTIKRLISIILGLIGLEIIVGINDGIFFPSILADWIALLAGFVWSVGVIFFNLSNNTSGFEKTSLTSLIIPFLFLFLCFIPNGRSIEFTDTILTISSLYIWIVLFAVIWLLPSILLTFISVEILDAGRVNILLAFEVIIGIASAAILTNEIISYREYLGAIFVIMACCVDVFNLKKLT